MGILDLFQFFRPLKERVGRGDQAYPHYLGGKRLDDLLTVFDDVFAQELSMVYSGEDGDIGDYKFSNVPYKDKERHMKRVLLRLEFLLGEIKAFREGEHSEGLEKAFTESTCREAEIIFDILNKTQFDYNHATFENMGNTQTQYKIQKQQLVESLLDSLSPPVVPILGKVGSGKTTLARLVYNDAGVEGYFDSKHWISLSSFTTHGDLLRVVGKATSVGKRVVGKKYLFVFDGLSNVDIFDSVFSKNNKHSIYNTFVAATTKGSKILVTSRVEPRHVGVFAAVSMPSLGEDESWSLFQDTASKYLLGKSFIPSPVDLQICKKCENNPGIIQLIASIISSIPKERKHFLDVVLPSVPNPITTISFTLDLMSVVIDEDFKRCLSKCSLLPVDVEFHKVNLFPLLAGQPFHEENLFTYIDWYFVEFVRNGYFYQCDNGSYKVSYLGHELMKYIAGDEFCLVDEHTRAPDHKIVRHVSFFVDSSWRPPSWVNEAKQLQSLFLWPCKSGDFIPLPKIDFSLMNELQILHFGAVRCESLPKSFTKLKKLKYLKLGEVFSVSLPDDNTALTKLLTCDPRYRSLIEANLTVQARLALLVKFSGYKTLTVKYEKCNEHSIIETQHIMESTDVEPIISSSSDVDHGKINSLNQHQTLESLEVRCWKGDKLPEWAIDELSIFLHNLVSIQIVHCIGCRFLPAFNTLPHLSSLQLCGLYALEDVAISSTKTFYPSLKFLLLCDLPNFTGWSTKQVKPQQFCFPALAQISVKGCPKLVSMPAVQKLVSLVAVYVDATLLRNLMCPHESLLKSTSMNNNSTLSIESATRIGRQQVLETSKQHLAFVQNLEIDGCKDFVWGNNPSTEDKRVWQGFENLVSLKLTNIAEIVSFPMDLEFITRLEQLSLHWLANLKFLPEWIWRLTQLRQLSLHYCPKLISLPKSIESFSALEELDIQYCPRLTQFPESFPSLKRLRVQEFDTLEPILRGSQNLEELEINSCEELDWDTDSGQSWRGLQRIRTVKVNIVELEPLSKSLQSLITVEQLSLSRIPNLLTLPDWFQNFTQLSRLSIQFCPKLTTLSDSISNLYRLQQLHIMYCPKLTSLVASFHRLNALQQFVIQGCPELRRFPESIKNAVSLKQLEVLESVLLEKRCQNPNGEDWDLIKHIPNIFCNKLAQQENSTYIVFP